MLGLSSLLLAALVASGEIDQPAAVSNLNEATQQTEQTPPHQDNANTPAAQVENTAPSAHEETQENKAHPVTITNAIEPSMLKYKHWTGTYSPEIFTIIINDTPVATGETYTLASTETPLNVQFDYSFMNGVRKGSHKITYQVQKECTQATITFSWLDTWKVLIDNATPLKTETIS